MVYSTKNDKVTVKRYHIVTYNRDIKYNFIDYLRDNDFTLLSVSGYYFDGRGREGYYIEFNLPIDTDINAVNDFIDYLYREFEEV